MKFLADECCDVPLIESLRSGGHDVVYAKEQMKGEEDDVVLERAFRENRVLITEDKDFGELVYRLKKPAKGVILMRIPVEKRQSKWSRLKTLIDNHSAQIIDHFVIVDTEKFRFRRLRRT